MRTYFFCTFRVQNRISNRISHLARIGPKMPRSYKLTWQPGKDVGHRSLVNILQRSLSLF